MISVYLCFLGFVGAQDSYENKPLIVCSTTQIADFTRQIVGDGYEVYCILPAGSDPHTYQPKPADVIKIGDAKLCFENGLNLEGKNWMRNLASDAKVPLVTCTKDIQTIELDEHGEIVNDPHAWFTPMNAAVYVRNINQAMSERFPEDKELFAARTELYLNQLRALHSWIVKQVSQIPPEKRLLITSHDAFNYYCKEYGFRSAAPVGWSTGQEAGGGIQPERRKQVIESIKQFGASAIFVETSVNPKAIQQIAKEAGVIIGGELYSDSMGETGSAGESYIGMMRENTLMIARALRTNS